MTSRNSPEKNSHWKTVINGFHFTKEKQYPDFSTNLIEILAFATSPRLYFKKVLRNVIDINLGYCRWFPGLNYIFFTLMRWQNPYASKADRPVYLNHLEFSRIDVFLWAQILGYVHFSYLIKCRWINKIHRWTQQTRWVLLNSFLGYFLCSVQ